MKGIIVLLSMLILSGCATDVVYTAKEAEEQSIIKNYQFGEVMSQSVGERLILKKTKADVLRNVPDALQDGIASSHKHVIVDTFSPVSSFVLDTYNGKIEYLKGQKYFSVYKMDGLSLVQTHLKIGKQIWMVYLPVDNAGFVSGESVYYLKKKIHPDLIFGDEHRPLRTHVKFGFKNDGWSYKFLPLGKTSKPIDYKTKVSFFEQDLIYMGRKNNIIKILYREHYTETNKPGFTIEMDFDLNDSNIINYKSFSIEVVESTKNSIQYKVLSD